MNRDKVYLVCAACGILGFGLGVEFLYLLFPAYRTFLLGLLIVAVGLVFLVLLFVIIPRAILNRAIEGPKSLSGMRCCKCGTRRAMQEVSREFLDRAQKLNFDVYIIVYRCTCCNEQQEQKEHVFPKTL